MQGKALKTNKFTIAILAIYIPYLTVTLLLQFIINHQYFNWKIQSHQRIQSISFFVLTPSLISWVIAAQINKQKKTHTYLPDHTIIPASLLVIVTLLISTKAVFLAGFPLTLMFKSSNIISIAPTWNLLHSNRECLEGLTKNYIPKTILLLIALSVFAFGQSELAKFGDSEMFGTILLISSLFIDGFIPILQNKIKKQFRPTPFQLFENFAKWNLLLSLAYSIISFQMIETVAFLFYHPLALAHILLFGVVASLGQIPVYWFICHSRQRLVPYIISIRKITGVVLSIIFFSHQTTTLHFFAILIALAVIGFDLNKQIKYHYKISQQRLNTQKGKLASKFFQELEGKQKGLKITNLNPEDGCILEKQAVEKHKESNQEDKKQYEIIYQQQKVWEERHLLWNLLEEAYPSSVLIETMNKQRSYFEQIIEQESSCKSTKSGGEQLIVPANQAQI